MKEANSFKNCYVFIQIPKMYIYQEILDTKKALFCIIKELLQFKRKNLSHWFWKM